MPPVKPSLTLRFIAGALTALGFGAIGAWLLDRISRSIQQVVGDTMNQAAAAVGHMAEAFAPPAPEEQIPQQLEEEREIGDIMTPAEEFEASFENDDWTERAERELDDRIEPEIVLVPLEDRGITRIPPQPGLSAPDMAGEGY